MTTAYMLRDYDLELTVFMQMFYVVALWKTRKRGKRKEEGKTKYYAFTSVLLASREY